MKRKSKLMSVLLILICLAVLQTLPVFFLKPVGSITLEERNIRVHFQLRDEEGAREVFDLLRTRSSQIYQQMNYTPQKPIDVYIYHTQKQLAVREAGLVTLLVAPGWHIGDSHGGTIMMLTPYGKAETHNHETILNATLHELVHSIVHYVNPDLSYFWDNGIATYLAGQKPLVEYYNSRPLPSVDDMHIENGIKFGNMGGYAYSYKYIEFLDSAYGWEKVIAYARGDGGYAEVFGKTERELYEEWSEYMSRGMDYPYGSQSKSKPD